MNLLSEWNPFVCRGLTVFLAPQKYKLSLIISKATGMLLRLLSRFSCVCLCATPQTAAHVYKVYLNQ